MEPVIKQAVELIHKSPTRIVLYVTGGASHALSWLLSVPGASNTILECRVPYERSAFTDLVGQDAMSKMKSFSSAAAARSLAKSAYRRSVQLSEPGMKVCGIAAACSLVSTTPKRGDHRAFVAAYGENSIVEYALGMKKGQRQRWEEEELSSRVLLQALLDVCSSSSSESSHAASVGFNSFESLTISRQSSMSLVRELLVTGDSLSGPNVSDFSECITAVLNGDMTCAEYHCNRWTRDVTRASLIFSGSFNPLHEGHTKLMNLAKSMYPSFKAAYEISVTNPDKPPLSVSIVKERLSQFTNDSVVISRVPLFSKKAAVFPNSVFIVGIDTAERIVAPRYYGSQEGLFAALLQLKMHGCKFLVAGRTEQRKDGQISNTFKMLADIDIPVNFKDMFVEIPAQAFRVDISSSQIREKRDPNL